MAKEKVENRWARADLSIQMQIDHLMSVMRTRNKDRVAEEAGIKPGKFRYCYECPSKFRMLDLRLLMILFERYGLTLDIAGEGAGS